MKKIVFLVLFLASLSFQAQIEKEEPPYWWADMNHDQLELLIYGKDIAQFTASLDNKYIQIKEVKKTENSNYLFLNLDLSKAVSGKFKNLSSFEEVGLAGKTVKNIITDETFIFENDLQINSKGVLLFSTKL